MMKKMQQLVTIQQSQRVAAGTRVLEVKRSLPSQQVENVPRERACFQAARMVIPLRAEMGLSVNCLYLPVKVHENAVSLSSITNPKPKGQPSQLITCSGKPSKRQSHLHIHVGT
jgi:hypothetical protein